MPHKLFKTGKGEAAMGKEAKETGSFGAAVEKGFDVFCVCWVLMHVYVAWRLPL